MPAIIYRNKNGERVPSVTGILKQWGIKTQPLIYWAYNRGEQGIPLYEKEEADVGTLAHKMIDCDVKGKPLDLEGFSIEVIEQAKKCFENYLRWKKQHDYKPIRTEISLVSEEYQYGGTIDCVAMINGKLCIDDKKTGKDVYEDHIIQIVAYEHLWNENFPDHPIEGGYHIIRTGKEIASFDHRWYGEFPGAWETFLHLRALYDLHKQIKKLK